MLLFLNQARSQNFILVDSIVDQFPKSINHTDQLATLINSNFTRQDEKARAIFRWVATNISYDVTLSEAMDSNAFNGFSYKTEKEKELKEKVFKVELVKQTLETRKTVCHGYSVLFEFLCLKTGLEAITIVGTLKTDPAQIGAVKNELNHAWNVVKINGIWQFVDTTLAAGFISAKTHSFKFYYNDSYFLLSPERFSLNHYPLDEKWLMVRRTKAEFAQLPVYFGSYFDFDYNLQKPYSGLHSTKNGDFVFALQNITEDDFVEYSLSTDDKKYEASLDTTSKDFKISVTGVKDCYLSLFVNRKIIAIYKIIE